MYINQLQSPHPHLVTPERPAQPFLETLPTGPAPLAETIDAARFATRQALRYADGKIEVTTKDGTVFDTLKKEQTTNCYGYATVLSEVLSRSNVEHFMGFGNGHAFTIVPSPDGLRLEDALCDDLSGTIGKAISQAEIESIPGQLERYRRAGVILNAQVMVAQRGNTVEALKGRYPWLDYGGDLPRRRDYDSERGDPGQNFAISLFAPAVGRAVLQQTARLSYHTNRGQYNQALKHLRAIRGLYPEMDARSKHKTIKDLSSGLATAGDYIGAKDAMNYYFSSFGPSKDPRFAIAEGDMSRQLAHIAKGQSNASVAAEAYRLAMEAYRRAKSVARYGNMMLTGKITKTRQLAAALA